MRFAVLPLLATAVLAVPNPDQLVFSYDSVTEIGIPQLDHSAPAHTPDQSHQFHETTIHEDQEFSAYSLRTSSKPVKLCDDTVTQISGYLDVAGKSGDDTRHLFFWFFESRRNPRKDDLVMWLNGGPGCSSTTGLLAELGPCMIAEGGNGTTWNPHSWNEVANMIFLDNPINVGYSYADNGETVNTTPDAAKDIYAFMQLFFKKFPDYSKLPFSIAAESYGGTFVPQFGSYIFHKNMEREVSTSQTVHVNLASLMIGNGLTDPKTQFASTPDYACEPSPYAVFDEATCQSVRSKVPTCDRLQGYCYNMQSRFTCVPAALYCWMNIMGPIQNSGRNPYDITKKCDREKDGQLCYPQLGWIETYMNLPEVRSALGVDDNAAPFQSCNMDVNKAFLLQGDSMHDSSAFLPAMLEAGIRVLIYAGERDFLCSYLGNMRWFQKLDNVFHSEIAEQEPSNWTMTGDKKKHSIGMSLQAGPGAGNYTFVTLAGSGHMVPMDQPAAALDMFSRWLENKESF